jgi:hypothetical protein
MKFALTITLSSLMLTACSRQDSKIVGTWNSKGGNTIVFAPDGSFSITRETSPNVYWLSGIWKIKNGILAETITNCSNTNWPWMGQELQFHLIHLDGHRLKIEEASPIVKYTR